MNEATQNYIQTHQHDDVLSLSLHASNNPDVDMALAIRQILGMQKTAVKIPTFRACKSLLYPPKLSLEQSSSEITAQHKASQCKGNTLIDLTGGFGVDSYFFSFQFDKVIYVEQNQELCELAIRNFVALDRPNIEVVHASAESYLQSVTELVDCIFLDPARRSKEGKKVVLLADCEPDILKLKSQLLTKTKQVIVKLSPMIDISSVIQSLGQLTKIQVIAVDNECKEVIAYMSATENVAKLPIETYNYSSSNRPVEFFGFSQEDESEAKSNFAQLPLSYLYEPNAALLKSGAFRLVGNHYNLKKIAVNSHLYTSSELVAEFPGRVFRIETIYSLSKESLKKLRQHLTRVNLSTRNFPLSVNDLRKKLKLSEGGDSFLFATTLSDASKALIHCYREESKNATTH